MAPASEDRTADPSAGTGAGGGAPADTTPQFDGDESGDVEDRAVVDVEERGPEDGGG